MPKSIRMKSIRKTITGQWDDGDCTTFRPYVCSMPVQSELPKRDLENFNDCPEGWRSYGPACFQINTDRKSYAEAKQFCDSQNARRVFRKFHINLVIFYRNAERKLSKA